MTAVYLSDCPLCNPEYIKFETYDLESLVTHRVGCCVGAVYAMCLKHDAAGSTGVYDALIALYDKLDAADQKQVGYLSYMCLCEVPNANYVKRDLV